MFIATPRRLRVGLRMSLTRYPLILLIHLVNVLSVDIVGECTTCIADSCSVNDIGPIVVHVEGWALANCEASGVVECHV